MLHGRGPERARLDAVVEGARKSHSQALVIRGEAGVGKSALLRWAADRAAPARCLRAVGVESEVELPFAGLHQLFYPVLDGIDALPPVQADALRGALGLGTGRGEDRFLVAAGVLTLLAEVAADHGLVCIVDDAQWADPASVDALVFAARRLVAEGVVVIFAGRDTGRDGFAVPGLPELVVEGLDPEAADALLAEHAPGLAAPVRRSLVERTAGNPLALIELPSALTPEQRAGHEPLPEPLPVGLGIERVFAGQAARLPEPTRRLLALAAADDSGRVAVLGRAAAALGVDLGALGHAEASGLTRVTAGRVEFRHPLVRSAVYQQAAFATRQAAHLALAATFDAAEDVDRKAWHLAAAATGPDDEVAHALEESAARALSRSGPAAAAAALRRAAVLSATPAERGRRLVRAAEASWTAGLTATALAQLDEAEPLLDEPARRAGAHALRGLAELSCGRPDTAYPLLVTGAADAEDPDVALTRLALAGEAASLSGGNERVVELGALVRDLPSPGDDGGPVVDMLTGMADAVAGDWAHGAARLRRVAGLRGRGDEPLGLLRAGQAALLLGDDATARRVYERAVRTVRRDGAVGLLATALNRLAFAHTQAGRLDEADAACGEGLRLACDLGQQGATGLAVQAFIEAWRGDADACRAHAEEALAEAGARRLGAVAAGASWALGLLDLGLGRPDEALSRLAPVVSGARTAHPWVALWAVPDLVEAAARAGRPDDARAPLERFGTWAQRVGAPWAIAAAHRGAAQLAGGDLAGYARAVEQHDGVSRPLDRARTDLAHGEALRRRRRRVDARVALRAAAEAFDRAGATPWAERARAELRATGESVGRRGPADSARLTPQELQITRLAAGGASNPEIAVQLFLSRKTVEYHLHKVFTKLGMAGRAELARLELNR